MWSDNHSNVITLARHLVETGQIDSLNDLIYYFEKPFKLGHEWNEYQASLTP